jgi:hypothetical protein
MTRKKTSTIQWRAISLFFLFMMVMLPANTTAQYAITRSSIDAAGEFRTSASFRLVDACGQTAVGVVASSSYTLTAGFLSFGLEAVGISDAETGSLLPKSFALLQNFPNPFNPQTTIRFDIPESVGENIMVQLDIFNIRGQRIRSLVDEKRKPGSYVVHWDGRDQLGQLAGSGVYLYRVVAGKHSATKKMVIMK